MHVFHLLPDENSAKPVNDFYLHSWRPSFRWGLAIGSLALLELVFSATRGENFIYAAF